MKKLIKFFVDQSLLVNMLTLLIIIAGIGSVMTTNREGYPKVERKMLTISTFYPGASPEEVEINVTIPLEDAIKGITGVDDFTSNSTENYSRIIINIEDELKDTDDVKNKIRRAIDSVHLPDAVSGRPDIWEFNTANWAVMEIALFSPTLPYDQIRMRSQALKKKLSRLDCLSIVDEKGMRDKEVHIELDLERMNENYLSIKEVINALRNRNIEMTAGSYQDGNVNRTITIDSKIQDLNETENIIIRSTFEGKRIRLRDIARITDTFEEEQTKVRYNGQQGISLFPRKKESSDVIDASDKVMAVIEEYRTALKEEDITIQVMWQLADETRNRLKIVQTNALIGLALVLIILFIFMSQKNAFWTAAGIPFSIAVAMVLLKQFGLSINSISLLGIIVVMGMVVDDAIIISENIYRHRVMGKSWKQAAYEGTTEVAWPVVTTILTTIASFLSLFFALSGLMGEFASEIPMVVIFVLTGSLIESLIILPNHISHDWGIENSRVIPQEKKFIIRMREKYKKLLRKILDFRWPVVIFFFLLLGGAWYVLFSGHVLKFIQFPIEEATAIDISGEVKKGQNLDFTASRIEAIDQKLESYPENVIISWGTDIGEGGWGALGYPERFSMRINITRSEKRDMTADEIVEQLRETVRTSGYFTNTWISKERQGPPVGRAISIQISGNDNNRRRMITDDMVRWFENIKGTRDLNRSDEEKKLELRISINQDTASRLGVSPLSIGQTIRAAFTGVVATEIQTPDELIQYRVLLDENSRNSLNTLQNLKILNNQNKLIPLSHLIQKEKRPMISRIGHYNGDRTTTIDMEVDRDILAPTELMEKFKEKYKDFELDNPGFEISIGGEAETSAQTIRDMIIAAVISISIIFFILILLFRSFTQSFMVLLPIPFSLIGIALALLLHGDPLSMMSLFGLVGLGGVAVNDSLVMVDFINQVKKKEKEIPDKKRMKALIAEGASTRLRPVLLTTITTVAGLLPTAYGLGGKDAMIQPTTLVMAWGLVFATLLTLILIPCLYLMEFNMINTFHKIFKKKKPSVFFFLSLLLFQASFWVNDLHAEDKIISLNAFIQQAMENDPHRAGQLLRLKEVAGTEFQAKAVHEIGVKADAFYIHDNPTTNSYSSLVTIKQQTTSVFSTGIQWLAPYTGTALGAGLSWSAGKIKFTSPVPTADFFSPSLNFYVSQPLLRNFRGLITDFPLRQSELNRLITEQSVNEEIENILISLHNLYFDWYLSYQQFRILSTNVINSETLLDQIERKYTNGLADRADLAQTSQLTIQAKKGRDLAEAEFLALTEKIQYWMNGSRPALSRFHPVPQAVLSLSFPAETELNINDTRQMRILNLSRDLLAEQLKKERNEYLPSLDVNFSWEAENTTETSSESWKDLTDFSTYTAGLSLAWPLGNHAPKGRIKEVSARISQWEQDRLELIREYTWSFDRIKRLLKVYQKVLQYDQDLIEQSRIQLQEEKKKYDQGRSDLYFIIQDHDSLLRQELTFLQDQVSKLRLKVQALNLLDLLYPEKQ